MNAGDELYDDDVTSGIEEPAAGYRCVEPDCDRGGPFDGLYRCDDKRLRCWPHRAAFIASSTLQL